MKPVGLKSPKSVVLSKTSMETLLKDPRQKSLAQNLVSLLCEVCNGLVEGRDLKFGLGKNKKTGQLYAVLNEGDGANWANGDDFIELLEAIQEAL